MAKIFDRVSSSISAGRAAVKSPVPTARMVADLPKTKRYILALILGQSPEDANISAAMMKKIAEEKNYGIILVTDQTDIRFFQIDGCITEYLPPFADLTKREGALSAETYLERRLSVLIRKWEPVQTIPFGVPSKALFDLWQKQK